MEEKPQKGLPTPVMLTKEERLLQFKKEVPKNDPRKALCKQQHFSSSTENALFSANSYYSFYPANLDSENVSSDIKNEFLLFVQRYNEKLRNQPVSLHNQKELSQKHTASLETPDHPVLLHNQKALQQKRPFLLPLPDFSRTLFPTSNTLNAVPLPRVDSTNVLQTTLPPRVPDRPRSTPVPSLSPPVISIRHDNLLAPSPTGITYQNNLLSQPPTNSIVNSPPTIRPLFSQFIPGQNSYAGSQNGGLASQQRFMHPASEQHSRDKSTNTAATSSNCVKTKTSRVSFKIFKTRMSAFVIHCLMPYYKTNCPNGKITNSEDFKYLARKLTHSAIRMKLMNIRNEDSKPNENKDGMVRDYIRKYMANCGPVYKRE